MKKACQLITIICLLSGGIFSANAQMSTYYATHHNYRAVPVAEGLIQPWAMAWLPNGDMLITEKPGRLRIVRDGQLLANEVPGVPGVVYEGQGGLFDVLPHPDFADNQLLYLSFAKPTADDGSTTAIVRGRLNNDRLTDVEEIFAANSVGRGHYGGRMAFDEDGYLFLSIGDRQAPPEGDLESHPAQDTSNHHGAMVRLNDDGSIPSDNPFIGERGVEPAIWSYGHRSPQGLAFHPETGDLWETEHGPQGGDELNLIVAGNNYGWPVIGYGVNYGPGIPIHESSVEAGMEQPTHFWVPSIAASGLLIYTGDKFPQWYGDIFAGGLAGEQLGHLMLTDGYRNVEREETLLYGIGRIRDVRQGPNGYIYVAVEDANGEPTSVVRLEPVQ